MRLHDEYIYLYGWCESNQLVRGGTGGKGCIDDSDGNEDGKGGNGIGKKRERERAWKVL